MGAPVKTPRKPSLSESYGCTHLEISQQPVLVVRIQTAGLCQEAACRAVLQ